MWKLHLLVDPDGLAELDQLVAARVALEPVEHLAELRACGQQLLGRDDREAEVERQQHDAQRAVVLCDEVVQGRPHPVAWPALLDGVGEVRVQASLCRSGRAGPAAVRAARTAGGDSSGIRLGS